jgi:acetyl esterase/lipase
MKNLVLGILFCLFTQIILAQPTPSFTGVDYVTSATIHQRMDVYIPNGLTTPAPVVMFIHGGGWVSGGKGAPNVPYFAPCYQSGFICVDINYTPSNVKKWPAQIQDCKAAIRFLKANAASYNIDTCRMAVMGSSAGGHLAAMMGTTSNVASLEGAQLGNTNVSSTIHAVVDLFGPTDFSKMDGSYNAVCGTTGMKHDSASFETNLLGITTLSGNPAIVQTANPITYISSDDAPFYIMHGTADCSVPTNQSILLKDALTSAGIYNQYTPAPNQGHGGPYYLDTARAKLYKDFLIAKLPSSCIPLSINNSKEINSMIVQNPINDLLEINTDATNFSIDVFSTDGQLKLQVTNTKKIGTSSLTSGLYIIKFSAQKQSKFYKIIKQ